MHNLYAITGYPDPPGTMEEEEEDDDYENSAPPYKDLPPKPVSSHNDSELVRVINRILYSGDHPLRVVRLDHRSMVASIFASAMERETDRCLRHLNRRDKTWLPLVMFLVLAVAMYNLHTIAGCLDPPGAMEEEEEDDDYENSTPPYKDLPPKPGKTTFWSVTWGNTGNRVFRGHWLGIVDTQSVSSLPSPCRTPWNPHPARRIYYASPLNSHQRTKQRLLILEDRVFRHLLNKPLSPFLPAVNLEPSPLQPSLAATPAPWLNQTSEGPGCCQKRWMMYLCLPVVISLILGCVGLTVTLIKYQELMEELRMLSFQQMTWRANMTGMSGLAGLKHDIDRVRADTNQSLVELRGLLGCRRVTCPEGWLPFEGKCYYFSPITKSWDEARTFCQENYSHLVIINSFAEHNFVAKAHGSPRVHWLGLNDRGQEGDWRWLDGSPVTLSFWEPEEPNNIHNEDCAAMNKDGTWNDLSCYKTTYWICERKCSC
nr:C-type lectin domain family 17, member A [Macaca nemestrina]